MKLTSAEQVMDLLATVDRCKEDVYLVSIYGDRYNLKSNLSQYIAIGALLGDHSDELELLASNDEDDVILKTWLKENLVED